MKKLICILLLAVALALAGCGGGSQAKTPAETEQSGVSTDAKDTNPSNADERAELEQFFKYKGNLKFSVDYSVTTDGPGAEDSTAQMKMYVDGEKKIRTDITAQGVETRSYIVDEVLTVCTKQDSWKCLKLDSGASDDPGKEIEEQLKSADAAAEAQMTVTRDGSEQIAGVSASCFKVVTPDATARYCFSKEGVPLLTKFTSDAVTSEMKATSYSTSIPSGTFDFPAEPESFDIGKMSSPSSGDPCAFCDQLPEESQVDCKANCGS